MFFFFFFQVDPESGYPCYMNEKTGEVSWERPVGKVKNVVNPMKRGGGGGVHGRNETVLPDGWGKDHDENGNKFYYGADGAVQWEPPPGATGGSAGLMGDGVGGGDDHVRSETYIPEGWNKDFTESGDKFYSDPSGAVQWDKPPGN